MSKVYVQIQWRTKEGWTYRVYEFSDAADDPATATPSQISALSSLVPGIDDHDMAATQTHHQAIEAAVNARFPGALIQFNSVPARHT